MLEREPAGLVRWWGQVPPLCFDVTWRWEVGGIRLWILFDGHSSPIIVTNASVPDYALNIYIYIYIYIYIAMKSIRG